MGDSSPVEESPNYEDKRTGFRLDFIRTYKNLCQGKNDTLWYLTCVFWLFWGRTRLSN
jgi:hypothetical protein